MTNQPHARRHAAAARILGALAATAPAAAALGADKSDPAGANVTYFNMITFASTILVFGAAFFILSKLAWPKITEALDAREAKIRDEILAAEEARERADAALKDYEQSLATARAEANAMIEKTKAEQARLAADLRQQAEAETQALRASALQQIDAAKRAALSEIYSETASLATGVAAKILGREVSEDDQRRIVDQSVEEFTNA